MEELLPDPVSNDKNVLLVKVDTPMLQRTLNILNTDIKNMPMAKKVLYKPDGTLLIFLSQDQPIWSSSFILALRRELPLNTSLMHTNSYREGSVELKELMKKEKFLKLE